MEDCLTRQVEAFHGLETTLHEFIHTLQLDEESDESNTESLSDDLNRAANQNESLAAEFLILKKEWDGKKSVLEPEDRARIGRLGEQAKALSFVVASLYNDAAERATSQARTDEASLATLQRGAQAVRQYRVDDDGRSTFDTQA